MKDVKNSIEEIKAQIDKLSSLSKLEENPNQTIVDDVTVKTLEEKVFAAMSSQQQNQEMMSR